MGRIFALEIVARPGAAVAFRATYERTYKAAAEQRGMRDEGSWRYPAVDDIDEILTIYSFPWSITVSAEIAPTIMR